MTTHDERALLKATAVKGSQSPSDIADRVGDARAYTLMSYALAVAVSRKFPEGTSRSAVPEFVAGLKDRYPDAQQILKPTVAEAVLWGALGEPERLEGIDPNDAGVLLFFLTHVLMTEANLNDSEVDDYVDSVLALADAN